MTPERLQQVEELVHAPPVAGGRPAQFRARGCGGEEALRREVESRPECRGRGESFGRYLPKSRPFKTQLRLGPTR